MKIGVIGAGAVGVGVCQNILNLGACSELVLIDKMAEKAKGEILDFRHAQALTFTKNMHLVGTDDYQSLAGADIVVITAGAQIKAGQTRLDLAEINSRITVEIAREIEKVAPEAILIVVTNPCDIATYFITMNTGFPSHRVISAGCIVDTARLMTLVSERIGIDPKNVSGYILGEHGSHCFMPWSLVGVAGQPIDYYCIQNQIKRIDPNQLLEDVRQAGFEIFKRKQNTTHGIAASVYRIIQAITIDEHSVLPVGTLLQGEYGLSDVVLSLPTVVNSQGAERILVHPFSDEEMQELRKIASKLSEAIADVAKKTDLN
jgi:L-lactate dehydrogenase